MQEFSRRTEWDTGESAFAESIRKARDRGRRLCDLTVSNPTVCGFSYEAERILDALHDEAALIYDADPRGIVSAREAVCGYYADHGAEIKADHVLLTTSTSEAYGYLFRLLCDGGDEVLVPQPGYPLFDFLAGLEEVQLRSYPLFEDFGWWIDFAALEAQIGPRTRAILVVNPANPTGHWTGAAERRKLEELCARRGLALIVDEVFLDYPLGAHGDSFVSGEIKCLTFVLSGLSKVAALPQMKVAWMVARGPAPLRDEALRRLEVVADTYLSMNAPAQRALKIWLETRTPMQVQIRARLQENLQTLVAHRLEFSPVEAGWSVVLKLSPSSGGAEEVFDRYGVILHPGSFYGLVGQRRSVASLLVEPDQFSRGVALLAPERIDP